jgi:hypothetical protein
LVSFVGALVGAALRPAHKRAGLLALMAVWIVIQGMAGMATGIHMVVRYLDRVHDGDKVKILAAGLGELANNGIFAAVLATILGVAYVIANRAHEPQTV